MYLLVDIVNIILGFVRHHCLFHMKTKIRKQDMFSGGEILILQYKVSKDDGQCPKSPVKIVGAFAKI
jgi:hypothetical protein